MQKSTQDAIKTELWDFVKSVGKGVATLLASSAIAKHVGPKVENAGKIVLNKMAEIQGKKDAQALDELARQSEESKKQATPPAQTPPPPPSDTPDGPVQAKFVD